MSIANEVHARFFEGRRTDEVRFVINDAVNVTSGPHAGRFGAVISILSLDPEVKRCNMLFTSRGRLSLEWTGQGRSREAIH